MHAIRDIAYRYFNFGPARKQRLENSAADFTVQLTDAVDGAAAADGQESHIEGLG